MAKSPTTPPADSTSDGRIKHPRLSPVYLLIQGMLIHFMAKKGVPTVEIAAALHVDRSYVIRSTKVEFAPQNEREARLLALAADRLPQFQGVGLKGLLSAVDVDTTLVGSIERPRAKLGPLAERRAAKEAKEAKAAQAAQAAQEAQATKDSEPSKTVKTPKAKTKDSEPSKTVKTPKTPKTKPSPVPAASKKKPTKPITNKEAV